MATPQRLPIVSGDDGQWGAILNQWLTKEHYDDGTDDSVNGGHQTITVRPGTSAAGTAPLKFSSGTLLSSPETGAVEFNSDRLYFTQTSSTTRKVVAAFDDASGATGDLYYRDSSGNFVRLAVGGNGNVLTVASGLPSWSASGGSGISRSINSVSTPTSAGSTASTDYVYLVTGATTITLPTAASNTNRYTVTNVDPTATVTVNTTSAQTIDGSTAVTLPISGMSLDFVSDNSNWNIQ